MFHNTNHSLTLCITHRANNLNHQKCERMAGGLTKSLSKWKRRVGSK